MDVTKRLEQARRTAKTNALLWIVPEAPGRHDYEASEYDVSLVEKAVKHISAALVSHQLLFPENHGSLKTHLVPGLGLAEEKMVFRILHERGYAVTLWNPHTVELAWDYRTTRP